MGAICGMLGRPDRVLVQHAAAKLKHRGVCEQVAEGNGYFFMSSTGPMGRPTWFGDGSPVDALGRPCSNESLDTALQTLMERGQPAIELRGAFAMVLGPSSSNTWCLLRDRLGQKPLYYAQVGESLIFASELKALLHALPARKLNLRSIDSYFTFRCVPGPETVLQGISRVRPGHALLFRDGQTWEVPFATFNLTSERRGRSHAATMLEDALEQATLRSRSTSLLFSSGIDSASLASLRRGVRPVFVALERAWQDEAQLARESAKRLHVPLAVVPGRKVTEETFARTVRALDEPIADPTVFALWGVLEGAREEADSFMTGHGADEILGGYPRLNLLRQAGGAHGLIPAGLLSSLQPVLPPNAFVKRAGSYLSKAKQSQSAILTLVEVFSQEERGELYTAAMKSSLDDQAGLLNVQDHFIHGDVARNMLALDLRVGLPDLVLHKCDRLAAANGITLEHPFLDDLVLDVVLRISPKELYGVRSKALLRTAMRQRLPGRTLMSARRDFRVPQEGRCARLIDSLAEDIVTPERVDASGLFRWHFVEQILNSASHNVYRRRQFWSLLMFFAWYREFMES
jgi:asparagine synthase (glutamine-hydrolysing)